MADTGEIHHDIVIRNGLVFDGTGAAPRQADVAISDGKVSAIAPNIDGKGKNEFDAHGRWVTPGFLDIHTHYDAEIEAMPGLEESVRHGVTTCVMGNCSLSLAMGQEKDLLDVFCRVENLPRELLATWLSGKITWRSLAEYYTHLESLPSGPNIASFIGHSNVRFSVMGMERSLKVHRPNNDELKAMEGYIAEAMEAGYLGMSIDLLPWHRMDGEPHKGISIPSQQARPGEYRALANVVRRYNGVLQATPDALHKDTVLLLLSLSLGVFRRPLRTTIVAALDAKTNRKVYRLATMLASVANTALNGNVRFQALAEPFQMWGDGPTIPFMEELPSGMALITATPEERGEMLRDPAFRADFRRDWESTEQKVFHCDLAQMTVVQSPDPTHAGKTFAQIAKEIGADPLETFLDLMAEYDAALRWHTVAANDRPEAKKYLLAHRTTLPGFNDSGAHNRNMGYQDGALRMLQEALRDPKWLSPEKAIHRLTGEPAAWLGLDAGTLETGKAADIAVIDPVVLKNGGLSDPIEHQDSRLGGAMRLVKRSDGCVAQVIINGHVAYDEGAFSPDLGTKRMGRLLRRN